MSDYDESRRQERLDDGVYYLKAIAMIGTLAVALTMLCVDCSKTRKCLEKHTTKECGYP